MAQLFNNKAEAHVIMLRQIFHQPVSSMSKCAFLAGKRASDTGLLAEAVQMFLFCIFKIKY